MNKFYKLFAMVMLCLFVATPLVLASGEKVVTIGGSQPYRDITDFMMAENLVGGGNVFYVDSGVSTSGDGTSWSTAKSTLDAAVALCTANSGDVILVAPGHAENLAAANAVDIDVAGVTVIGLGDNATYPTFTYTATAGEFVIGADSVLIKNLRFKPGISDVVMGISVEAAGDNFTMQDCEFVIPGTATFEFLDAIDLAALADNVTISNVKYRDGATSACNHFIEAGNGVNIGLRVLGCDIFGRFAVSAIWSDTADTGCLISDNDIANTITGQHAIEFTSTATGMIVNNNLYGDTENSILDSGSMYTAGNNISTVIDYDGIPQWVIDNGLNHLVALDGTGAYAETAANDSIIAKIMTKGATATCNTYNNTTDSLEAIADALAAGTGCTVAIDADNLDHVASTDTTVAADADLTTYVADGSILSHIMTAGADTSDYQASTDSLEAISTALAAGTGCTAAIDADNLDHIASTTTGVAADDSLAAIVVDGSILAHIMDAGAAVADWDASTDSLQAIGDRMDTQNTADQVDLDAMLYWQEKTVSVSVDEVTADLFDIDGGPILVKSFWGIVDVLIGANASTCTIQMDRDDAAADTELSTAVNIETDVAGTVYVFSNANPSVLTPLTAGAAGGGTTLGAQWVVQEGMLEQVVSADPGGAASDHITWYMTYVPLAAGVTVTAQ